MKCKANASRFEFTTSETKWELLLSLVFAVMIFKDILVQRKRIFTWETTFFHRFGEWHAPFELSFPSDHQI